MKIIFYQLLFCVILFITTLLFTLIPLKIVPRKQDVSVQSQVSTKAIAFCNCLSGGVFMGTCFISLLPMVRNKFNEVFKMHLINVKYPVTETVLLLGFFMILLVEQLAHILQEKKHSHTNKKSKNVKKQSMGHSTSSSDIDSIKESEKLLTSEETNLKLTEPNQSSKLRNGPDETGDYEVLPHPNHSHDNSTSGSHGHSHFGDLANQKFGLRCVILLLALSVHGVFEGLAVGLQSELSRLINLFLAVIIHECLVCFAMGISLAKQNIKTATVVKLSIIFCSMIPIGIIVGMLIGGIHNFAGNLANAIIQGLANGTFLYVIFLEILPAEINNGADKIWKVLFLFLGVGLIACLQLVMHD